MQIAVPTTISQTDSRRFRVKFAPIPPSTAAFETCRQFSAVMAPVVLSIREMEAGGFAARDKGTSAHDKVGSTPCALEGDSQFLGYGEDFESTQVISETQSSEMPNMTAGTGPILIPDESSLIPVPDIGKVLYYSSFYWVGKEQTFSYNLIFSVRIHPRIGTSCFFCR